MELNPSFAKAQNALGAVLVSQGKLAEAEQAFRHALETDSTLLSARTNLAKLLEQEGNVFGGLEGISASAGCWIPPTWQRMTTWYASSEK